MHLNIYLICHLQRDILALCLSLTSRSHSTPLGVPVRVWSVCIPCTLHIADYKVIHRGLHTECFDRSAQIWNINIHHGSLKISHRAISKNQSGIFSQLVLLRDKIPFDHDTAASRVSQHSDRCVPTQPSQTGTFASSLSGSTKLVRGRKDPLPTGICPSLLNSSICSRLPCFLCWHHNRRGLMLR